MEAPYMARHARARRSEIVPIYEALQDALEALVAGRKQDLTDSRN